LPLICPDFAILLPKFSQFDPDTNVDDNHPIVQYYDCELQHKEKAYTNPKHQNQGKCSMHVQGVNEKILKRFSKKNHKNWRFGDKMLLLRQKFIITLI
jgi:hypothetical protein